MHIHTVACSLQYAQLLLWQLIFHNFSKKKGNTKIYVDIKWLIAIRGACSKMDNNYPKMSQVEEEPKKYFFLSDHQRSIKKFSPKHHENILGFLRQGGIYT